MGQNVGDFGDDLPAPEDAFGRSVAGSQDFTITRSIDGHLTGGDGAEHDADYYANRYSPGGD